MEDGVAEKAKNEDGENEKDNAGDGGGDDLLAKVDFVRVTAGGDYGKGAEDDEDEADAAGNTNEPAEKEDNERVNIVNGDAADGGIELVIAAGAMNTGGAAGTTTGAISSSGFRRVISAGAIALVAFFF